MALLVASILWLTQALAAPQSAIFESAGVPIHYTIAGEGPAVVLLHGFAASGEMWEMVGYSGRLAQDHEVITVDCRGHGKSGKPHDAALYGPQMLEDLIGLLDHLQIEQAYFVGYSMGGMLTLKLSMQDPDRVLAAVTGGFGWQQDFSTMIGVADALEAGTGFGPLFGELVPEGEELPPEIQAVEQALLAANDPLALAAAARGFAGLAITEAELRANEVPVLAIVGNRDPLKADVDRMAEVMSKLRVEVIPGDHQTTGSSPRFLPLVQEFLTQHSGAVAETD